MATQKQRVDWSTDSTPLADWSDDPRFKREAYRSEGAVSRGASPAPDIRESAQDISRGLARANATRAQARYARKATRR